MTFCAGVKKELSENSSLNGCCLAAQLYGILLFSKVFSFSRITVSSEHKFIFEHIRNSLIDYGIKPEVLSVAKTTRDYSIKITDKKTLDRLFFDFGYTGEEPNIRILRQNFMCDSCESAFIAGCFIAGGNITAPGKGYHLEFSTHKVNLSNDLAELLKSLELEPRRTIRGYSKVLYFKNSTHIEDMLTFMGAANSSLELMNTKIHKEIVNTVNRRTNCETANIDKAVNASARDRECIEYVYSKKGKSYLPDDLTEIAKLRLDNPELTLAELGEKLDPPLTKSGVSHRLRRIRGEANKLKSGQ